MNHRWLCSVFALKSVQLDLSGLWFEDGAEESSDTATSGLQVRDRASDSWAQCKRRECTLLGVDCDPGDLVEREGGRCCFLVCCPGAWGLAEAAS